ncbi:hypothetical protein ABBQ32_009028 [Trebouxia sp. C0010 RCD-2024]
MKTRTWGGLAAAILVLISPVIQAAYTDVDILQFALNLECLEAEFYSWVAFGVGLTADQAGNGNLTKTPSGGVARANGNTFTAGGIAIATEIAQNEIAHVKFLRTALTAAGATPIDCPAVSLSPETFTAAANASVVTAIPGAKLYPGVPDQFNPYQREDHFYLAAFIFEDVGVTAYKGAIPNLQNSTYAGAAAGILALEAGHAATIRGAIPQQASTTGLSYTNGSGTPQPISFVAAANAIEALRDALGGTTAETPIPSLYAADSSAVAYTRTPSQVLNIVYFGSYQKPGGFFPNGIAGNTAVTEISGTSMRTCSGASMASLSVLTVAAVAAAAAFAL